jgi:cobalt-zinc-cadmium efflux system outer membrane protein
MDRKLTLLIFAAVLLRSTATAQVGMDTVHLTLLDAERMFVDSNFQLLAQRYNVDAQKALIIQARLWPNPNLSFGRGPFIPLFDPNSQFPHSNFFYNSENSASLSQLILLAGKRNKQIQLAQANAKLAEYQFFDLMRTLKYTLRTDFFNIFYLLRSASVYQEEINALQIVVKAFMEQEGKGYIAEKEVVRIKAQLYSLVSEYNDLLNQINDQESELKLVLQAKASVYILPDADTSAIAALNPARYPLTVLLDSAFKNRTDLLIARGNSEINKLNYSYQKALAVPDLTASVSWDRQGSYAINYNGLGIDLDLPFFNRNQGNIKSARVMIDNGLANQRSAEATVEENVNRAVQKAFAQDKLFRSIDPRFAGDFDRLMHEVLVNYQKRNISLLDFLDFYDSYKQNILQTNSIQYNRVSAFEDLNYYTATNFFN